MTPELGFALFVALLYGPTALWLVYRALRGHQGRLPEPFGIASEPMRSSQPAAAELQALDHPAGFWACETCRSLNRREANHCYRCRTGKGSAGRQAPVELPVSGLVPVMAEGIARSSGEAPGTTAALAMLGDAPPASEILARALEHVLPAVPPEAPVGVAVCPFVGFRGDPSTWYDFPDPRNVCHATSGRRATVASQKRGVAGMAGTGRAQSIGVEHQKSCCLTAAHEQCARYPAVVGVAANR